MTYTVTDIATAIDELQALVELIERPPLDDVKLSQSVALRTAAHIRTLIASAPAGDGVVVPAIPTKEMLEASAVEWTGLCHGYPPEPGHYKFMTALWKAMLEAAPAALARPRAAVSGDPMSLTVALDFAENPRRHATLQAPADSMDELREALQVLAAAYREARPRAAVGEQSREWWTLEWIAAPRPPVHMKPMRGSQDFDTAEAALAFWHGLPADSTYVGLTKHVHTSTLQSPPAKVEP